MVVEGQGAHPRASGIRKHVWVCSADAAVCHALKAAGKSVKILYISKTNGDVIRKKWFAAFVHSTVARAESPYSTLPVWPLCPFSWDRAHPDWGVGVRGTWKQITCVMVCPSGSGNRLRHLCGAPPPVPPHFGPENGDVFSVRTPRRGHQGRE